MNPTVPAQTVPDAPAQQLSGGEASTLLIEERQFKSPILALERCDHRFFLAMAILAAVSVFVGFFPTYYQKPLEHLVPLRPSPALATIFLVHGAVMTTFFIFYVLQTALVGLHRKALHMTLGWASVLFIPAMLILGTWATFYAAKLGHRQNWPDPESAALVFGLDVYVFATLAAAAILLRARPQAHKRLMLVAMINLLPAAIARSPVIRFGPLAVGVVILAFLFAGPIYDIATRRRIHPAYLWSVLLSIALTPPIRVALGQTQTWHHFVDWVIR